MPIDFQPENTSQISTIDFKPIDFQPGNQQPNQSQPSFLKNVVKASLPVSAIFSKEMWQPATQSLTGKSLTQMSQESPIPTIMTGNKALDTLSSINRGVQGFNRDVLATAADMATTPINYIGGGLVKGTSEALTKSRDITNRIFNLYNFSVGGKLKNVGDVTKIIPERVNAIKTISDNLPDIKLPNIDTGALESRVPQNRLDLLHAFNQTKKLVWNKVNTLSKGATEQNAQIDLSSIGQEALAQTKKDIGSVALKTNPTLINGLEAELTKIKTAGTINPTQAEDYMKFLNSEVQRLRQSGQAVDYSVKDLYSNVLNKLNDATDSAIEKALNQSGYRDLRKQYSSLKSAEKEILGGANKFLRQQGGGGSGFVHPIVNLWSVEELLQAGGHAFTGNIGGAVSNLGRAATVKWSSKIVDFFRNPDKRIPQMFQLLKKYSQ